MRSTPADTLGGEINDAARHGGFTADADSSGQKQLKQRNAGQGEDFAWTDHFGESGAKLIPIYLEFLHEDVGIA